ncbi:MAG TPA: DUF2550 domain-containing protein [Streptosporangiaceae bacterium]
MGGALALDAAWVFAAFLLVLVLIASGIAARRFLLERRGGTVDCGLRRPAGQGSWRIGVASYQRDQLRWYHLFGVLLRPQTILERRTLSVVSRRLPGPPEASSLGPGFIIVECQVGSGGERVELAMSEPALTGFLAWLEAAPPGSYLDQIA